MLYKAVLCFSVPLLSETEAREALVKHVAQRCCYGKQAAQNMQINKINASAAFQVSETPIINPKRKEKC